MQLRGALSAAGVALILAGCGATRPDHAGGGAGSTASGPGGALIWNMGPGDAPPSIAAENARAGTAQWRLPPRAEGRRGVEGYVAEQDVHPGDRQRVYVRASRSRQVRIKIYRMGWYGGLGARLVARSGSLAVVRQPPCRHTPSTGLTECRWRPTLSFTIPRSLPAGVYVVALSTPRGDRRDCLFVVQASRPAPLIAQISTATYEAYNAWGGNSLYPGGRRVGATGTTQGVEVSYDRPYDSVDGAGQFLIRDVALVRFLERYGYPVSYITNQGVARHPDGLLGARALVDSGHSEYWSQSGADAFRRARDRGVNLAFLSSDTLAWRVRLGVAGRDSSEAGSTAHRITAYKEHASRDPVRDAPSGAFADNGAGLTGSAYTGCITPRVGVAGRAVYRYYDWRPDPGAGPSWLFARTGLRSDRPVHAILGYELDRRTSASPPGVRVLGGGVAPCQPGAAGSSSRGDTTLYRARSGAMVFATGTLGWEFGLSPVLAASPAARRTPDPGVVALTRNLLDRMLGSAAPRR